MPNYRELKVGDRIRLLNVPPFDLKQREQELEKGLDEAGWTANTIERIIAEGHVLEIYEIDEYGYPWFEYLFERGPDDSEPEEGIMAVMDNDSWEHVTD